MKKQRIYIDTSVVGGCLDEEFREDSCALFEMARRGEVVLLFSDLLTAELVGAPDGVRAMLECMPSGTLEQMQLSEEAAQLRDTYLDEAIVGQACANDAYHVALATVAHADVIVSWNFRHIVHLDKIRGFNAVNIREGYGTIEIRSPREVT